MEYSSSLPKADINSTTPSRQRHAAFYSFLSDDSKLNSDTTTSHRKIFISLLKDKKLVAASLSEIWENTDGCAEQYKCDSAIYFMSVMLQFY